MNRLGHRRTILALAAWSVGAAVAGGCGRPAAAGVINVFAATSWQPPPAPAPPAPAPAPAAAAPAPGPPIAPALPFRFFGRYGDAGVQIVMLLKGEQLYLVSVGDTIDGAYRVDRVSATTVELTYLPLQLKQSLSTGDAG
jgi:hypothetical protein